MGNLLVYLNGEAFAQEHSSSSYEHSQANQSKQYCHIHKKSRERRKRDLITLDTNLENTIQNFKYIFKENT